MLMLLITAVVDVGLLLLLLNTVAVAVDVVVDAAIAGDLITVVV